jgi:hypothetical protein
MARTESTFVMHRSESGYVTSKRFVNTMNVKARRTCIFSPAHKVEAQHPARAVPHPVPAGKDKHGDHPDPLAQDRYGIGRDPDGHDSPVRGPNRHGMPDRLLDPRCG